MKEITWCHKKGIIIYPLPVENVKGYERPNCYIRVNNNGKLIKPSYIYKQDAKLYDKIRAMYVEFYNTYR